MKPSPSTRGRPSRAAVIASLDRAVDDLAAVGGLPLPAESEEIWKGIWHEETHHSTALELVGETDVAEARGSWAALKKLGR